MKNTINNKLRRLPGMLAGLLLLAAAACNPESLRPDYETDDSARSAMTLEFGISAADAGVRTRSATTGDEMSETFKNTEVQSLWIGVFDVETGDLVGKMHTKKINYSDDDAIIPDPDSLSVSGKAKVDILYYDAHPTVRIFGVANYDKVKAHDGIIENRGGDKLGDLIDLYEILERVESMSEFFAISVDAESANEAQLANGAPLMMGVYSESEDIFTIKAEVNGSGDATTVNFVKGFGNADKKLVDNMYDRLQYKNLTGSIRLRRLLSQVNVEVKAGLPGIKVSNLHYRKVNMPKKVYLQERQTTGNNGDFKKWKYLTPNIADALVKTDGDTPGTVAGTLYYESDEEFIPAAEAEMSFQFHQYENKHWGLANVEREKTRQMTDFAGNPVFSALCSENETGTIYNNYASYFEIKLDVTDEAKDQRGTVTYRIHEGLCNDANGRPSANNQQDFCCFRNTIYNYTITVYGLNSFDVTAEGHNHDAGVVEGTLTSRGEDVEIKQEGSDFMQGKLLAYVCYYENNKDPKIYGYGDEEQIELLCQAFPELSANADNWIEGGDVSFGFKFGDKDLREYEFLDGASGLITVATDPRENPKDNPKNHRQVLYVLVDASKPDDPCATYKYYQYYYLPVDNRPPIIEDPSNAQFLLKFANKWDKEADKDNGAVTGYIRAIEFSKEAVEIPDGATPEYKVYLDDNLVYTGDKLETIDLWTLCNDTQKEKFIAYSIHKVKVTISDVSEAANYIDYDSPDIPFMVYPTEIEWDYAKAASIGEFGSGSYFYAPGSAHIEGTDDNIVGLRYGRKVDIKENDQNTFYMQTGGAFNYNTFITFTALYDGILTIESSYTDKKYWSFEKESNNVDGYLTVTSGPNNDRETAISYEAGPAGDPVGTKAISNTFYVKKGMVSIAGLHSHNIYRLKFTHIDQPNITLPGHWKFSDEKWESTLRAIGSTAYKTNFSYSLDGLSIVSTGGSVKGYIKDKEGHPDNCVYFNNTGTQCEFVFWVNKSGTLSFLAAGGSLDKREFQVAVNGKTLYVKDAETTPNLTSAHPNYVELSVPIQIPEEGKLTKIELYSLTRGAHYSEIKYE